MRRDKSPSRSNGTAVDYASNSRTIKRYLQPRQMSRLRTRPVAPALRLDGSAIQFEKPHLAFQKSFFPDILRQSDGRLKTILCASPVTGARQHIGPGGKIGLVLVERPVGCCRVQHRKCGFGRACIGNRNGPIDRQNRRRLHCKKQLIKRLNLRPVGCAPRRTLRVDRADGGLHLIGAPSAILALSQRLRFCDSSGTISPFALVRAKRRESCSNSSASRPPVSGSSGIKCRTIRASRRASSVKSVRINASPGTPE